MWAITASSCGRCGTRSRSGNRALIRLRTWDGERASVWDRPRSLPGGVARWDVEVMEFSAAGDACVFGDGRGQPYESLITGRDGCGVGQRSVASLEGAAQFAGGRRAAITAAGSALTNSSARHPAASAAANRASSTPSSASRQPWRRRTNSISSGRLVLREPIEGHSQQSSRGPVGLFAATGSVEAVTDCGSRARISAVRVFTAAPPKSVILRGRCR